MGSDFSHEEYDKFALEMFEAAVQNPCLFPDIFIEPSLLKYSGVDSNQVLQGYSDDFIMSSPGYANLLTHVLTPLTSVSNAVGLGALVISMILDTCVMTAFVKNDGSYNRLQHVFAGEGGSDVWVAMLDYLNQHRALLNNDPRIREEIWRHEARLSKHLAALKGSLLQDQHMTTRGLKIWVNAAYFHLQMLIHDARLNPDSDKSNNFTAIETAHDEKMKDLDLLLYWYNTGPDLYRRADCGRFFCGPLKCYLKSDACMIRYPDDANPCKGEKLETPFKNYIFAFYRAKYRSHFSEVTNNKYILIRQHQSFILPAGRR